MGEKGIHVIQGNVSLMLRLFPTNMTPAVVFMGKKIHLHIHIKPRHVLVGKTRNGKFPVIIPESYLWKTRDR